MKKKRIRIPESDETGYNIELISSKAFVVAFKVNYLPLEERTFKTFDEAYEFCEQFDDDDKARIEEVIYAMQIKTVHPEKSGPLLGEPGV